MGEKIGIYLDENLLTEPIVQAKITDGAAVISGMNSSDEAKRIAVLIKTGISLPCSFSIVDFEEAD